MKLIQVHRQNIVHPFASMVTYLAKARFNILLYR